MLFPWLTLFDFGTFRANFIKPVDLNKVRIRYDDFVLLIPIFNDTKYLTNIEFLSKYKSKVILCTTTNESPDFMRSLRDIASQYGFQISVSEVGGGKKNPWAIYNKTLLAHDQVLKHSISTLEEKYVVFLDGDTVVDGDISVLVGAMEEKQYDIASVKVLPAKRSNLIEKLQGIEYDIAMQARLIYPWLTSGAGIVAKRQTMINIMRNHSLFFNGGDIEIGKLADAMGYKTGHLPMVFYTDVPNTFRKWAKQRFSWMCGCFRHSIINMDHQLRHPFHFLYFSVIIYMLLPYKLFNLATHLYFLPVLLLFYAVLTYFANWKVRSKYMFVFPVYALFQVTVLLWCGIYRYVYTVRKSGNVGRIKVRYNPNNVCLRNPKYTMRFVSNYSTALAGLALLTLGTSNPIQQLVLGRSYELPELLSMILNGLGGQLYTLTSFGSTVYGAVTPLGF